MRKTRTVHPTVMASGPEVVHTGRRRTGTRFGLARSSPETARHGRRLRDGLRITAVALT